MSEKYEVYSGYVVAKGNDSSDVLCVCITEEDADAIVDAMNTKDEVETLREKLQQVEKILGVGHAKRTATTQEAVKTDPPLPARREPSSRRSARSNRAERCSRRNREAKLCATSAGRPEGSRPALSSASKDSFPEPADALPSRK